MLLHTLLDTLKTHKAKDIQTLDVRDKTTFTDTLVICSATSDRHAKSIAESIIKTTKVEKAPPIGVEGLKLGEWVLVDLDSIIVHIMLSDKRKFYELDTLWTVPHKDNQFIALLDSI